MCTGGNIVESLAVAKIAADPGDPWENATGTVSSDGVVVLSFHFPLPIGMNITKNGTVSADCNTVAMHDVSPGCVYTRCQGNGNECPSPNPPPGPPPSPLPRNQIVPWLRAEASQLLKEATVNSTVAGAPPLLQPGIDKVCRSFVMCLEFRSPHSFLN
jgi:hypothetical protein